MLMKATKFCKQKCYFLTFFCPADDLVTSPGDTLTDISRCKKAPGWYPANGKCQVVGQLNE